MLLGAFSSLFDDLKAITRSFGDVSVAITTYRATAGETKRVSPPAAGMGLVLPSPSPENRGSRISIFIENPEGLLRVFVAPNAGNDATVNGQEMVSFADEGLVVFESNGVNRWNAIAGTFVGATGAANGYASLNVYTSASSPITYTTAADIPAGNIFTLHFSGPGGGGGAGASACGSTVPRGGGGGAGGARLPPIVVSRAALIAMLPVVITLPAGGAGGTGVARTAAGITVGADGAVASADATISANGVAVYTAFRGGGGSGGNDASDGSGGGGGGLFTAGTTSTTVGTAGGRPLPGSAASTLAVATNTSTFGGGFGANSATASSVGGPSVYGGGGGGASFSSASAAGGQTAYGGSGGGAGGVGNDVGTAVDGSAAGAVFSMAGSAGGALANGGTGAATGASGTPGVASAEGYGAIGGGGGGGANGLSTVSGARSVTGGNGGVGGQGGGGGGGGGGAFVNNTSASNTALGGNGGNGGSAQLIIVGLPG